MCGCLCCLRPQDGDSLWGENWKPATRAPIKSSIPFLDVSMAVVRKQLLAVLMEAPLQMQDVSYTSGRARSDERQPARTWRSGSWTAGEKVPGCWGSKAAAATVPGGHRLYHSRTEHTRQLLQPSHSPLRPSTPSLTLWTAL